MFGIVGELTLLSADETDAAASEPLSYDDAVRALTEGLAAHEDFISITLETGSSTGGLWIDLLEDALLEDGNPEHGDYLRCSLGLVNASRSTVPADEPGRYLTTFIFDVRYKTSAGQQRLLFEKANELIAGLDLDGKSDYQKAKAVYDFVCSNVIYGSSSLPQGQPDLQYTAYAALVHGQAVCEGYAALFDLLAGKAGLSSRIVIGEAGGSHAWNIVQIDGLYYNVDPTWDAGSALNSYGYFLKSDADFDDHVRGGEEVDDLWFENYRSEEFYRVHPMASTSYVPEAGFGGLPVHEGFTYTVSGGWATIQGYQGSEADIVVPARVGTYPSYPVVAIAESAFSGNGSLKSVVISEGVTAIGSAAFRDCTALLSVVIPEGVQEIAHLAFSGCTSLVLVEMPLSLLYIESYAFSGCSSIERIDVPRGVWLLGTSAFSGCSLLREVSVPRSVMDFGRNLFTGLPRNSVVRVAEQWQYDELSGNAKYLDSG
ncbi:MAG: leucine-rich repeat protein, partial [Eggerthellaceae bacterium]|nr:leucine-rich repeat protein [Eggerthellaceae bacterium]